MDSLTFYKIKFVQYHFVGKKFQEHRIVETSALSAMRKFNELAKVFRNVKIFHGDKLLKCIVL